MSEFEGSAEAQMSPAEKRQWIIKKNVIRLEIMKDAEELSRNDYGFEDLCYLGSEPVTRKELGNRALVITQEQLEELGGFSYINEIGEEDFIDPDVTGYGPDDKLIIFPSELGDTEE